MKALLIGDPTDDLAEARREVQDLAESIRKDDRFDDPVVLIGSSQCQRTRLLSELASGQYGLIHYSGHTCSDGYRSAWRLVEGTDIITDMLTNALQIAPPAFVFNSSHTSVAGAEVQPLKYQDQAFDLPSAFLQAGVEAYVGTLWEVDSLAARLFVGEFYEAFLSGEHNLGECVRLAKWAGKQRGDYINWLAFILYGDPLIEPGDLLPALRRDLPRYVGVSAAYRTEFQFGRTTVRIIQGNILAPGVDVDVVVSSDDNYLTMGSGVSRLLANAAGHYYVRAAQAQVPLKAGTVVVTNPYRLPERGLNVKHVFHGAVIDYDTCELPLEQLVYQTTTNCLETAEQYQVDSILFPAFATGAGGLTMEACARQMCTAIKTYLAQERPLKAIYIILYHPQDTYSPSGPSEVSRYMDINTRFIREANLVLGVPYNPALHRRQIRDFYGREDVLRRVEAAITGALPDKRHAAILGGARIGKTAVLDQFLHRARQPGSDLGRGRHVARVAFGRVNENTPASFIYRKLLLALGEGEDDVAIKAEIRRAYADPYMDCDRFLMFLEEHADRYPQVVLLIDDLPRLLDMEGEGVQVFWRDLDKLEARMRFVYTASDDRQYEQLLERLDGCTFNFKRGVEVIKLTCLKDQERQEWIDELFQHYLDRKASRLEQDLCTEEAGRHPYLVNLAGYALIEALQSELLVGGTGSSRYRLDPIFQKARRTMDKPRQEFFDLLIGSSLDPDDRANLSNLAKAVAIKEEQRLLLRDIERGDPDAIARWQDLQMKADPRQLLDEETLGRLEAQGYVVDAQSRFTVQFMAKPFATWAADYFGVGPVEARGTRPAMRQ